MVSVEGDCRPAKCLTNLRPLEARWDHRAGTRLEFEHIASPYFGPLPQGTRLSVSVENAAGERELREFALEATANRWHAEQLPLEEFSPGEALHARFELSTTTDEEVLCAIAQPRVSLAGTSQPTVILVTSDTHRADHFGLARGPEGVETPFLDRLARAGTWFSDCRSSTNVTNPSHIALMTGLDPRLTGVTNNFARLPETPTTLAELFGAAGWTTWSVVSNGHLSDEWSGLGQGFDRMNVPARTARPAQESVAVIEEWLEQDPELPLFLWLHLFDAHTPYEVPEEYLARFWDPAADPFDHDLPEPDARSRASWLPGLRNPEYVAALYRAEVAYLDDCLARLFEHPRFDRALVAVTADHGENLGEHEQYWNHNGLFPETLGVPLILNGPGCPTGRRRDEPVRQMDLGRTLLDWAGIDAPAFPGRNLLAGAEGPSESTGPTGPTGAQARYALSASATSASLQLGEWYLMLQLAEDTAEGPGTVGQVHQVKLFHLPSDSACTQDRSDTDFDLAARLRHQLVAWLCEVDFTAVEAHTAGPVDAHMMEALAELGYGGNAVEANLDRWIDPDCTCPQCARFRKQ
jgi:arylsulfatase A-like enzyme